MTYITMPPMAVATALMAVTNPACYEAYFDHVRNPTNALTTQTLPFAGGLEMTVKL